MYTESTAYEATLGLGAIYDFVKDPRGSVLRVQDRVISAVKKFDERIRALPVAKAQLVTVREIIRNAPARDAKYAAMLAGQYNDLVGKIRGLDNDAQRERQTASAAIAKLRELGEATGIRTVGGGPVVAVALAAAAVALAVPLTRWAITADSNYRSVSTLLKIARDRSGKWTEAERKKALDAALEAGGNPDPFSLSKFFSSFETTGLIAVMILFLFMQMQKKVA